MRLLAGLFVLCLLSIGCITNPTDQTYTLSFPLVIGTVWNYDVVTLRDDSIIDSQETELSVTAQQTDSLGNEMYEFTEQPITIDTTQSVSYEYYQKKDNGMYLYAATSGGAHVLFKAHAIRPGVTVRESPVLWIPTRFQNNQTWHDTLTEDFIREVAYIKKERVTVPAGTYDCFVFEASIFTGGTVRYWISSGIGLVLKEERSVLEITKPDFTTGGLISGEKAEFCTRYSLKEYTPGDGVVERWGNEIN